MELTNADKFECQKVHGFPHFCLCCTWIIGVNHNWLFNVVSFLPSGSLVTGPRGWREQKQGDSSGYEGRNEGDHTLKDDFSESRA